MGESVGLGWGWRESVGLEDWGGGCGGPGGSGDVCETLARAAGLRVQGRMERTVSGDGGPGAQERMGGYVTVVGLGESGDVRGLL